MVARGGWRDSLNRGLSVGRYLRRRQDGQAGHLSLRYTVGDLRCRGLGLAVTQELGKLRDQVCPGRQFVRCAVVGYTLIAGGILQPECRIGFCVAERLRLADLLGLEVTIVADVVADSWNGVGFGALGKV